MSLKPTPTSGVTSADEKQFERLLRLVAALQATAPDAGHKGTASEQSSRQAPSTASQQMDSLRQEIEQRAYQIYLERGGTHGWDMADWLQAEMELRERLGLGRDKAIMRLALAWGLPEGGEGMGASG